MAVGLLGALTGAALAQSVDINGADFEALDALPGLGPAKAQALVSWRAVHGPCEDIDELAEVPGFGIATLAALRSAAHCGTGLVPADVALALDALAPVATPGAIDINRASSAELEGLPGVAAASALAIVKDRSRNGPYRSCDDLLRVPGVGPATVATFGDRCTTEP